MGNFFEEKRIRIVISLVLGFGLTLFISNFIGQKIPNRPTEVVRLVEQSTQNFSNFIVSKISSIPQLFSNINFGFSSLPTPINITRKIVPTMAFDSPPPTNPVADTPTVPSFFNATISPIPINSLVPTKFRLPTNTPKPTAKPPTPTPEIVIGLTRPGKNRDEVANIAGRLTCVPPALIKAINDIEALNFQTKVGSFFSLANTYGWWKKSGVDSYKLCAAFAYNTCTGAIPSDSNSAGYQCRVYQPGLCSSDIKIMGSMQISEWAQNTLFAKAKAIMKQDTIDRRVTFDAFVIAALYFKNTSFYQGSDCNIWPLKNIVKAACKYQGKCANTYVSGNSVNYCQFVCDKYNQYAGTNYNCSTAGSLVSNDGKCDF